VDSRQICRDTISDFTKKNEKGKEKVVFQGEGIQKVVVEKGKEKVVFQGEGIQKVVVQLSYKWGYDDSIV
jgi:hypothetical protein